MKYDSVNNLVKKTEDNKTTYYINKEYEYTYNTDIKTLNVIQEFKHNLFSGSSIVAVHTRTKVNDEKQVDKTAYIHKDSLGSVDTVTNSRAQIVLRNTYTPFGALLSSLNPNTKFKKEDLRGYTSHKQLYSFNLIDMGGRMYDPRISRFLSVDPLISMPYNSQRYNRYNYVMNNPLKYIDPSGYDPLTSKEHDKKWGGNSTSGGGGGDSSSKKDKKKTQTKPFDGGTVTYSEYNNTYNVIYDDNSGFGHDNGVGYTHDTEGQYTTENYDTGELSAGWNGGNYKQHSNGIETFSDSNIGYHSVSYENFTIEVTSNIVDAVNTTLDSLGTDIGKIGTMGIIGGISGSLTMKNLGPQAMAYGFAFGLASGIVVGAASVSGYDISRYTTRDAMRTALGL